MAIDYGTDIGKVRLLIADTDDSNLVLTDEQVTAFLALETAVKLAAAAALEAISTSEVLVSKVLRTRDGLQTDGAKVAAELRARAKDLRAQYAADLVTADEDDDDSGGLEIVDFTGGGFASAELAEWPAL